MTEPNNPNCFFVSDLHGRIDRYRKLFQAIHDEQPRALFMGGDLLPHDMMKVELDGSPITNFLADYLIPSFTKLRKTMRDRYPRIFLILGNDDARAWEDDFIKAASAGLWEYLHKRKTKLGGHPVFGYSHVPPTPFLLKDWERYDVSRFVDPGCLSPEEGMRSAPVGEGRIRNTTIKQDLEDLTSEEQIENGILLLHTPPYKTNLDRAALDGKMVDHVPLDVHVGSIAVRRFIESRQPLVTLHGHVHESSRLTGSWKDRIGATHLFSAAYHGPELALVVFDLDDPSRAERRLI